MTGDSAGEVTLLLNAWSRGDETALERIIPLVYSELHHRAERYMSREHGGHTLQPTALLNEVYLRLVDLSQQDLKNRAQFFAICAQLMRRILVDFARSRHSQRRGGGLRNLPLNEAVAACSGSSAEIIAVDDALNKLSAFDARKGRVVELRFFAGLGVEETAQVLKVSPETVKRDWKMAKVWLLREIGENTNRGA
jgi:RNA polymerase sigma factor (TIGR02999 family)